MPKRVPPFLLTRRKALGLLALTPLGVAAGATLWPALAATSGQDLAASGQTLLASGNTAEAVGVLREAAKADPANPWVWNLLGRAYATLGNVNEAVRAFRSALRVDPGDGYSRMMLDRISQHPLPAPEAKPATQARPGARKRLSALEEQAQAERQAFLSGQSGRGEPLVVLDPGHGGLDPGFSGPEVPGQGGLTEKTVTLDLAKRAAKALEGQGVHAVLTREDDYAVPLWARAAMAALHGADAFVSLHATAVESAKEEAVVYRHAKEARGPLAQTVASLENGVIRFERQAAPTATSAGIGDLLGGWKNARLAVESANLAERLAAAFKAPSPVGRASSGGAPLELLGMVQAPAVLVECGFLSSPAQAAALSRAQYREELAQALARALVQALARSPVGVEGAPAREADHDAGS